jgi:hypothetical protein
MRLRNGAIPMAKTFGKGAPKAAGKTITLAGKGKMPEAKPQGKGKGSTDIKGGAYDSWDESSKEGGESKAKENKIVGGPYND